MTERYIGLCMAAGGVVTGVDPVLAEVRRGKVRFVLLARNASDRTKKQITDKCTYYRVPCYTGEYDSEAIAHILGKKSMCSAAAFTGRGPWACVKQALETAPTERECCDERKDDC